MRKLIMFNAVTIDGFFAGPNGEIDWHNVDAEFNDFAIAQLDATDGLIFGRVTYQLMAGYWPTPAAIGDDPIVAGKMNALPKFVCSRTLDKADWNNTRLLKANAVGEIATLKQQPGRDLFLFGSANLASSLTPLGLIDEYRIMVMPVVLGSGKPLFENVRERMRFKLANSKTFRSGNVLLYYHPDRKQGE
jgi:dihydrofolate reductase